MKVYTVVHVFEEIEVTPFVEVYTSLKAAQRAVEHTALVSFEAQVDPNDGDQHVFAGLEWNDDGTEAWTDRDEHLYTITECDLKS